ncbi:hypothetical protein VULLAG_LOCUS19236 [Vulpes lagopus]
MSRGFRDANERRTSFSMIYDLGLLRSESSSGILETAEMQLNFHHHESCFLNRLIQFSRPVAITPILFFESQCVIL